MELLKLGKPRCFSMKTGEEVIEDLDKLSEKELRKYLKSFTIDKIPKGDSRFICNKHKQVLSYADIVSGCYSCIMDEANTTSNDIKNKGVD